MLWNVIAFMFVYTSLPVTMLLLPVLFCYTCVLRLLMTSDPCILWCEAMSSITL